MTEVSDEFQLEVPAETALWACREAAAITDWPLLESIESHRIVLKKGLRFGTGSLSKIEVLLTEAGPDATTITMRGTYPGGFGRGDERTMRSLMNSVRNAIEVSERRSGRTVHQ
jgi:hypothetical protein